MSKEIIRENPFCIISKEAFDELNVRSIRTSTAWLDNPDPDNFAVVPDDMVPSILNTSGFCDIELNEDGTEVVAFTAKEIPELPEPEDSPTQLDIIEAQVTYTAMMTDTMLEV